MVVGCEVVVVMVVRSVDLMMKLITFRFRLVTVAMQHEPCQLYLDPGLECGISQVLTLSFVETLRL